MLLVRACAFHVWNMCEGFGAEDSEIRYIWFLGMPDLIRRYCHVMMKRPIKSVNCIVDRGDPQVEGYVLGM